MSIMENIKEFFSGKDRPIDVDRDGKQIYREDVVNYIQKELERRRTERKPYELQWTLNANFLLGNQYCDIHPGVGDVEQRPMPNNVTQRETFNRIAPIIQARIGNLKKIRYQMTVKPKTSELDDFQKAEVATAILRSKQNDSSFDMKVNTALYWNELCGNVFWLSWWNPNTGNAVAEMHEEVIDAESGLVAKKGKVLFEGDVEYGLISAYEIFPESIYKQGIENQNSIIIEQVKKVDDIETLYGYRPEGRHVETFHMVPISSGGGYGYNSTVVSVQTATVDDAEKVLTYLEKPSVRHPKGCLAVVVGNELVYYDELPYDAYPISQMMVHEVAGHFFGKSVIEDLIPLQRTYNAQVNAINEYNQRAAIGTYMVEKDSVDIDEFIKAAALPGSAIEYERGYDKPAPLNTGSLPQDIWRAKQELENMMEYVAGVSQLQVIGDTPSGVTSGTAIEQLQEIDNTRLAMTGDHIRQSVKEMAKLWLSIYKRYASGYRVMQYVGSNSIGSVLRWSKEDITSYDVEFDTENELLVSDMAQKEEFSNLYAMGIFTEADGSIPQRVKRMAIEAAKLGNFKNLMGINDLQMQAAQRENTFFEKQNVIPEVSEFDDHEVHIDEHKRYILQETFHIMKLREPDKAAIMEGHIKAHQEAVAAEMQNQMQMMQGTQGEDNA